MCLTVKKPWWATSSYFKKTITKPKIAKKDIICYKVYLNFSGSKTKRDGLYSPFHHAGPYEVGDKLEIIDPLYYSTSYKNTIMIREGFHSLVNNISAYNAKNKIINTGVICKCIIPKGSKYYKGIWSGNDIKGYVSDTLIINEILVRYE